MPQISEEVDAQTIKEMREKKARRAFMTPQEFQRLRETVLCVTQPALAEVMQSPLTGEPVSRYTVCRWERGITPVPLWAARRLRRMVEVVIRGDGDERP